MSAMTSVITGVPIVYSTVCLGTDQRKHQSSASLAFVRRIHRWLVNPPHKGPVTLKMFSFDEPIMWREWWRVLQYDDDEPLPGGFPSQRPVTRSFDVFFDLRQIKRLSIQSPSWLFETPSNPSWRHCNVFQCIQQWWQIETPSSVPKYVNLSSTGPMYSVLQCFMWMTS